MLKKQILIVEDETIVAEDIKKIVNNYGYNVIDVVSSGEEAIKISEKKNPDLVLMDILLEDDIDGIDVAKHIRKLNIPVIFITAYADNEKIQQAKLTEPFGYLLKPFRERELIATIEMAFYKNRIEKALKESEEKFRTLVETTEEGISIVNENETFTFVNKEAAKIFGCTVKEIIGKNLSDFTSKKEYEKILLQTKERKKHVSSRYEVEISRRDGKKRFISVIASPKFYDDKYIGAFGIFNDITEQKKERVKLKKSIENFKRIFENIKDVYYEADFDGTIKQVSPSIEDASSYTQKDLIGKSVWDLFPDEHQKEILLTKIIKDGFVNDYRINLKDKDGIPVTCSITAKMIQDNKNKKVKIIGSLRNLSDQIDSQKELKNSEEKYRKLFESSIDAVMMLDRNGFFDCNKATLNMFDFSNKNEFIKIHPADISPPVQSDGQNSIIAANININDAFEKGYKKFEWIHRRKNGKDFPAEVWLTSFNFKGKNVLQATVRDLTERNKAKEDLQKAHDELEQRVKERTFELSTSNKELHMQIKERKQIEKALKRKSHLQELLLKNARYINSSLDLTEVLKRIASEIMDILNSYGCTIYLLDKDGETLIPKVVIDPEYEKEIMNATLDVDSSFTGKAVKAKISLMFNNANQNTNGFQIPGTPEISDERIIVTPFVAKDKVLGAMCLNRIGPSFTDEDLSLADTYANYATTAIKNAQTFEELQHETNERYQAEKAKNESEKRYTTLRENVPVGIFRATPKGELLSVNQAMVKMFKYNSIENLRFVRAIKLYSNPEQRKILMDILKKDGEVQDYEAELLKKDNTSFWCSLSIKTISDDHEKWIFQDGIITDITERKQAEQTQTALYNIANAVNTTKDLNELFKIIHQQLGTIIDTTNFYIALYDKDTNLISAPFYVDEYTEETPQPQKLKKGITAYVIKTGKPIYLTIEKRDKLVKEGKIMKAEWKSKIWLGVPLKIDDRIIGAMAVQNYKDPAAFKKNDLKILKFISEQIAIAINRKRAVEALRKSEQLNRAIIDNSPVGITARDRNGTLLLANKKWQKIWNKTVDDLNKDMKKRDKLVFGKRDVYLKEHIEKIRDVYNNAGEYYIPELKLISSKNKQKKWISHHFYAIQDEKGNVDKVVILTEDITYRKEAEEKLQKTQLRLATIFEHVPNIILYENLKNDGFISNNIYNLLGYSPKEILTIRDNFLSFIHPDDKKYIIEKTNEWIKSGEKGLLTLWFRIKKKNGTYIWLEDRMVEIKTDNGENYEAGLLIDISNIKKAEEELKESYAKLKRLLEETINGLVSAVEMRDPYTAGHQRRVALLATAIAEEMGMDEKQIEGINFAALVHDIGKINVPAEILSKPSKLTESEFNLIKMHPRTGYDILKSIEFPWPVAETVLQHQERYNGSAYPQGLKGKEINFRARILGVADVIEAMSSHRPYRPSLGIEVALDEIKKNRGKLYDPEVVDACLKLFYKKGFKFPEQKL
ncbi:MAG: PAS domain S-box protein [Candidatus Cloacimonetes bacterium]|nr:PAS domain S-box protein [Candidatus Cloacimonadota bacterium]